MKIWLNTRINYSTFVAGQECTSHSWCAAKYSNTDVMVKMDFKNIFVYLYSILREGLRESVYTHANIHTHLYLVAIWSQTVYLRTVTFMRCARTRRKHKCTLGKHEKLSVTCIEDRIWSCDVAIISPVSLLLQEYSSIQPISVPYILLWVARNLFLIPGNSRHKVGGSLYEVTLQPHTDVTISS